MKRCLQIKQHPRKKYLDSVYVDFKTDYHQSIYDHVMGHHDQISRN